MDTNDQKVKSTSRPQIDTLEHFKQEFEALYKKIEADIANATQYNNVELKSPDNAFINNLNRLKLHRAKLREMLTAFGNATEDEWLKLKPAAQDVYEKAQEARREINRGVA